jgi:hypothetical protein
LLVLAAAPETTPTALLDRAETAYYAGRLDDSWSLLDQADKLETSRGEIPAERARELLLRAAVKLKQGDATTAETEAKRALTLDPDLRADSFPPPVQQVVSAARLQLPPRLIVRVTGAPAEAQFHVDGRPAPGGVITVLPGTHHLDVHADGFAPLSQSFDAKSDRVLAVSLMPVAHPAGGPALGGPGARAPGSRLPSMSGREIAGWSLIGASAVSFAGGTLALYDTGATAVNRSRAQTASQRAYYDRYETRFALQSALGMGGAALAGVAGWRLVGGTAPRHHVAVVPARDGAAVVIAGEF